ncbi:MAG: Rossmann-like and DUF2520 domain-containing protein [Lachnospiraceae bacterium]
MTAREKNVIFRRQKGGRPMKMQMGFIGAGKVGYSLGRYFTEHGQKVAGYYSQHAQSAADAAAFTESRQFQTINELVEKSDVLFLTVPDGKIAEVWEQVKTCKIAQKLICHCSGAMTSEVFSDIDQYEAYGYSIHPLFAIHDKYESYKELSKSFFTIEGHEKYRSFWTELFSEMGNAVQVIPKEGKTRYHAAAAIASNLMVALVHFSEKELEESGFSPENARKALSPILSTNLEHILESGCVQALTGPLERNDLQTVQKHLGVLEGNDREIYKSLSRELIEIAQKKNPERTYNKMEELLK